MIASKPRMPAATITPATTRNATTLVRLPSPQPSRPNTVAVAKRRQRDQHGLPADEQQVGHRHRAACCRRRPKAARESTSVGAEPRLPAIETSPTSRKRQHRADHGGDQRLRQAEPEAEHERAVGDGQHRDVGRAPRPEQLGGRALALRLVDDVDAVGLDAEPARLRGDLVTSVCALIRPPLRDGSILPEFGGRRRSPSAYACATSSARRGPHRDAVRSAIATTSRRVDARAVPLDRGDRGDPDQLHVLLARRDRLGHRRHAEQVGAHRAQPPGLRPGLVVRPAQPGVDPLGERRVDRPGQLPAAAATRRRSGRRTARPRAVTSR